MSDAQSDPPRRFTLLAIVLPFLGVLVGAGLEHGAGFVCRTGLADCAPTPGEADELASFTRQLTQLLQDTQAQLGQCQDSVLAALGRVRDAEQQLQASATPDAAVLLTLQAAESQLAPLDPGMFRPPLPQPELDVDLDRIERGFPQLDLAPQQLEGLRFESR